MAQKSEIQFLIQSKQQVEKSFYQFCFPINIQFIAEQQSQQAAKAMSDNDHIQQPQLEESTTSQEQNHNNNPTISIQSSQEFQNIDTSQSQQVTASFNTLVDSVQGHEEKQEHQEKSEAHQEKPALQETEEIIVQENDGVEGKQKGDMTQEVQPEITEDTEGVAESKYQQLQAKQVTHPEVDYNSIVSIKIFEKKINESLEFKTQGNEFFKNQQYQQAIQKYSQGLRILDPQQFYGATPAQCQKMAEVSASLLFNIASCFFNINSWRQAEVYLNETIIINPNHIKAIYKRALCRYELQNYEDAMADIKLAFNKDKSNVEIHKSYEKILEKYNEWAKKSKESMKEISSKIFRKESQNSVGLSQKDGEGDQVGEEGKQVEDKCDGEEPAGLWSYAPLIFVAGAALVYGYRRFFGK